MSYKAFLVQKYDYTHENQFFRTFSIQLKHTFANEHGSHILIGNVGCNGHQFDALFIANGKIIVIDFKNYGGVLKFSENNPWQIMADNDVIFVNGRGSIRNPYQQVNAYRHSLIQFLDNKIGKILDQNHENFNLGHISGMITFHKPTKYHLHEIPKNIQSYFSISDINNFTETIVDNYSKQVMLSEREIQKLLIALDINDSNIYNDILSFDYEQETDTYAEKGRLDLVKNSLKSFMPNTLLEKLLVYYYVLINTERQKEPTVTEHTSISINWANINDVIQLNIESYQSFNQLYQKNKYLQFPKDVFVGINLSIFEQQIPLLYLIIPIREIINDKASQSDNIKLRIMDFQLNSRFLEDRNYPNELLEELIHSINISDTLEEKIKILKDELNEEIVLNKTLTLAFSEPNQYTSQLLSEINKLLQNNLVKKDSLLERFLLQKEVPNNLEQIPKSNFIEITPLNKNQKEAVSIAFNQPISVITGPPGTGKTQVVVNIIANALIQNKKVLFASKNNQAVENVKERISTIINEPDYFLRFGSKFEVRNNTVPALQKIISLIQNKALEDNTESLLEAEQQIKNTKKNISSIEQNLKKIDKLHRQIKDISDNLKLKESDYNSFIKSNDNDLIITFLNFPINKLEQIRTDFIICKREIEKKYSGIFKILFNLINLKKYIQIFLSTIEILPLEIKLQLEKKNLTFINTIFKNGNELIEANQKVVDFFEEGLKLIITNNNYESEIKTLTTTLTNTHNQYNDIYPRKDEFIKQIKDNDNKLRKQYINLLNEKINNTIRKSNVVELSNYKHYIPDSIPWKNNEIPNFTKTTKAFLNDFKIIAITNLSIKNAFPLSDELFDILVIDEASQCDIASSIPLILRAKQLTVIGDPLQLRHITKIQSYEEKYLINKLQIDNNIKLDYVNKSLFDYCQELSILSKSEGVFLKEHFRCHPQIINFSNINFYKPKLGQELDIKTNDNNFTFEPKGAFWVDVKGKQSHDKNTNQLEVAEAVELAVSIAKKNPNVSIGITTPFNHQSKEIIDKIPNNLQDRIKADTVHKFQGDEKDIMIISLVVTDNSPSHKAYWINKNVEYLINVAVTRAKNTLYIIGNADYCKKMENGWPLRELVNYIDSINHIIKN